MAVQVSGDGGSVAIFDVVKSLDYVVEVRKGEPDREVLLRRGAD